MSSPFSHIAQTFDQLVVERGDAIQALDYGSVASQQVRFGVLEGVWDLSGASVLDVGCGFAHYADYLEQRYSGVRYKGIDLSSEVIRVAQKRRPDLDVTVANVLDLPGERAFDVVNANGIFYLLGDHGPEMMPLLLERMWQLADRALVFSSLSTWASHQEPGEFQADPVEILTLARRRFSPWLVLRHDYMPHDFTLYVYRRPPS